jgi:transcriptional regulator with XRE-family HTH domain
MTKAEFLKQLGASIAKHRLKKKLTQTEVAYACDFERGNLTRIEKGKANVTAETLLKISEALDVPVAKFFAFQNKALSRTMLKK